ncbi:hypothetical protein Caci_0757 [Catenulispora acidiphila DSM 44928]|uniref:Uncharacterized protein n=1 Tax=Catenulispora acidiphila (strain DSM 44928 / JCM 14897 / NBRC 102108 / NRRL B-24433 / ID139908) TaxID=479433 RepID=C7Q0R4_CATAD|nr:hypothetical protein [Catenulispora acidiphila]ACU69692.1 hypothetical protein Caci_0757 [Catenulispora acidiphila DSM 44928]
MDVSGAAEVGVSVVVVLAGLVGLLGLVAAARFGTESPRGRTLLLFGLGGAGVVVGLIGSMIQGYTVRVGGSGPRLLDAGDPASAGDGGSGGFAFPFGSLIGLALLTALLLLGGALLRAPRAVGAASGGWLLVVAALTFGVGSGGDIILPNDSAAQIFVYGGLVIAFGIAVLVYQWNLNDRLADKVVSRSR